MFLVVGVGGYMGRFYIRALLKLGIEKDQIIGVDINPENLEKVSKKYPGPLYTESLEKALEKKPNTAIVVVNSPAHASVLKECRLAGVKKLFVEKPLVYNPEQLEGLNQLDLKNLYTGYLINFSGIVKKMFRFLQERNLIVVQARAYWGKNWCAVDRPMGGDAEEEMPHALALILSAIKLNQEIEQIEVIASTTYIPYMKPEVMKQAKDLFLGFSLNDSSLAGFSIKTATRTIHAHLLSSFNFYEQQRRIELSLIKNDSDSDLPEFKACLEFDKDNKDILRIKEAQTDKEIVHFEWEGNKLQEQLKAVLKAFAGEGVDERLVDFEQSSWLVHLVHKIFE